MSAASENQSQPVIWITGASSGIGAALAQEWDRRGARVILSARRETALNAVAAQCSHARVLPMDLTAVESFAEKTRAAEDFFGPIDMVVHNAGISQRSAAKSTPLAITREIMETNFFGAVALTQAVLPMMLARGGGRLVVISSLMGKFGASGRSSYAASKHALHGYFEALRAEEYAHGIRVTLVTPGYVKTAISQNAKSADGVAHNALDPGQAAGISPEKCARIIVDGVAADREEILVGGKEKFAVLLKRFAPRVLSYFLRGRNID